MVRSSYGPIGEVGPQVEARVDLLSQACPGRLAMPSGVARTAPEPNRRRRSPAADPTRR